MQEHQSMCYEKLHSAIDTRFDTLQSIISSLADNVASLLVFSTPTTNLDNPPSANGVPHASPIFYIGPNGTLHNLTPYSKAHSHHHNTLGFGSNN